MRNNDYTFTFPQEHETLSVFRMEWTEAGRRYRIFPVPEAGCWRIIKAREKGMVWDTIEEYDSLDATLESITSYRGPLAEEQTEELYQIIRETLANCS